MEKRSAVLQSFYEYRQTERPGYFIGRSAGMKAPTKTSTLYRTNDTICASDISDANEKGVFTLRTQGKGFLSRQFRYNDFSNRMCESWTSGL
jgi:hypothetical protein